MRYTRAHECAERTAMRRWLRQHGVEPKMGNEPSTSEKLMKQVLAAGGNTDALMAEGRNSVEERIAEEILKLEDVNERRR